MKPYKHFTDLSSSTLYEESEGFVYGVPELFLEQLRTALEQLDSKAVSELMAGLHPADVAEIIVTLSPEERETFIELAKGFLEPEVLVALDQDLKDQILPLLKTDELAAAVSHLDTDNALYLLEDLEEDQQREILDSMPAEDRAALEEVMTYPEYTAGRLMKREVVWAPETWKVGDIKKFLATQPDVANKFYEVFIVDPRHYLVGAVSLATLLKQADKTKLVDVMSRDLHKIPVIMDQHEITWLFRHYNLISAPVVDMVGRIVGMITVDDVVEIMDDEAEKDLLHLSRVSESDYNSSIIETFQMRTKWLLVTLLNTLLGSSVISQFQWEIEKKVALAVLMPIVAAMGGNAGMQVVTVTVRALATRGFRSLQGMGHLIKEVKVGALNGLIFAGLLGSVSSAWFHDPTLGMVLGGAMLFNMIWASFAGACLPIVIARFGKDPALSAGPLLTTTTDVLGFAVFLGLARFLLP